MHVRIISPERAVFDGDASALVAPAYDGEVGVLPRHAPFMTLLGRGVLKLTVAGGTRVYHVRGGFLQVLHDTVSIVTEHASEIEKGA